MRLHEEYSVWLKMFNFLTTLPLNEFNKLGLVKQQEQRGPALNQQNFMAIAMSLFQITVDNDTKKPRRHPRMAGHCKLLGSDSDE